MQNYFSRFLPTLVVEHIDHSMLSWFLVAVCSQHCFKNPYLVSKIVEVLFVIHPNVQDRTGDTYSKFLQHELTQNMLPSALMKFYTDVETTGANSEFYDKFAIRYHISLILKGMWKSTIHRTTIINESKSGTQFVKFINMLMNDTTFLLDESLESLKRIHEIQVFITLIHTSFSPRTTLQFFVSIRSHSNKKKFFFVD